MFETQDKKYFAGSSSNSTLGLVQGIVDMDDINKHIKSDPIAADYYIKNYVRIRIPSLHGLPKNYNGIDFGNDTATKKAVNNLYVPPSDLPWAKIILPIDFSKAVSGQSLRDALGLISYIPVYAFVINGDLSSLCVIGRQSAVSAVPSLTQQTGLISSNPGDAGSYQSGWSWPGENYISFDFAAYETTLPGHPWHAGIDCAPRGTKPCLAIHAGTVKETGSSNTWGNYVVLEHTLKVDTKTYYYYSVYGHMRNTSIIVRSGQKVAAKQQLGIIGNTGNSTGPHVHLGVFSKQDASKPGSKFPHGYISIDKYWINKNTKLELRQGPTIAPGDSPVILHSTRENEDQYYYNPKKLIQNYGPGIDSNYVIKKYMQACGAIPKK